MSEVFFLFLYLDWWFASVRKLIWKKNCTRVSLVVGLYGSPLPTAGSITTLQFRVSSGPVGLCDMMLIINSPCALPHHASCVSFVCVSIWFWCFFKCIWPTPRWLPLFYTSPISPLEPHLSHHATTPVPSRQPLRRVCDSSPHTSPSPSVRPRFSSFSPAPEFPK